MQTLINLIDKTLPQIKPYMNNKTYIVFTWGITLSAIFCLLYGIICGIMALANLHANKYVLMIPLFVALILIILTAAGIVGLNIKINYDNQIIKRRYKDGSEYFGTRIGKGGLNLKGEKIRITKQEKIDYKKHKGEQDYFDNLRKEGKLPKI